jgi:hypothetical protein
MPATAVMQLQYSIDCTMQQRERQQYKESQEQEGTLAIEGTPTKAEMSATGHITEAKAKTMTSSVKRRA